MSNAELMRRAAGCFERAGWIEDACRCLEETPDHHTAGRLYESVGRWSDAARAYETAGRWLEAARCCEQLGRFQDVGEYLLRAGRALEAAWALGGGGKRRERARQIAEAFSPSSPVDTIGRDLVLCWCDGKKRESGARLREALAVLVALPSSPERDRLEAWARKVIHALKRPDLAAFLDGGAVPNNE